jgi:glycosyltransferase involved in cell wall biosynthesis
MVSVICPVYNEEKYIIACIDSILFQDYPKDDLEVLFVDGNSTDNTVKLIEEYVKKYPFIVIIHNPARITPVAMNLGIKESHGEIIIRLDAHAIYAPNYISVLVNKLIELDADNVGCIWKTDVLHMNSKSLAIREVLSNRLGVGNAIFRLGISCLKEVDTVPFGCWKRDVFDRFGYFDERLARNQDIELNKRIKRGGGKIYLVPDTHCTYLARETFRGIAENNYANGKWNILTVYYTRHIRSLSLRHFIPMLFLLSLILPISFAWLNRHILYVAVLSLVTYLFLLVTVSFLTSIRKEINLLYLIMSFIVLHISYGFGSLIGIIKVIVLWIKARARILLFL